MAQRTHVVLLFGGRSAEHDVSLISARSIYNNLDRKKYDVSCIYINKGGAWRVVASPELPPSARTSGPFHSFLPWKASPQPVSLDADIYFPVLHGPYGEDGTIQGLLEMADVPYVGAAVLASALGMDKAMAKILFVQKGLPVVAHLVVHESAWKKSPEDIKARIEERLSYPVFVKPTNLGSSVGITKVKDGSGIEHALTEAFRYDEKALIEEAITGREIECSVLGHSEPRASLPGEIIPYREFYDYRDKYIEGKTSFRIPAELPEETVREVQRIALEAFRVIGCSGMARV
ncbi:MAG: D-alanine--D-alanine ligase family protein, partial [Candidatus Aminicenantales bacterium]